MLAFQERLSKTIIKINRNPFASGLNFIFAVFDSTLSQATLSLINKHKNNLIVMSLYDIKEFSFHFTHSTSFSVASIFSISLCRDPNIWSVSSGSEQKMSLWTKSWDKIFTIDREWNWKRNLRRKNLFLVEDRLVDKERKKGAMWNLIWLKNKSRKCPCNAEEDFIPSAF